MMHPGVPMPHPAATHAQHPHLASRASRASSAHGSLPPQGSYEYAPQAGYPPASGCGGAGGLAGAACMAFPPSGGRGRAASAEDARGGKAAGAGKNSKNGGQAASKTSSSLVQATLPLGVSAARAARGGGSALNPRKPWAPPISASPSFAAPATRHAHPHTGTKAISSAAIGAPCQLNR